MTDLSSRESSMAASATEIAADTSDNVSPRDGVQKLLSLIDNMRARPSWWQGDVPLPTVIIDGQAESVADAAAAIRGRQNPPPCAFVTVDAGADTQPKYEVFADALRQAAEQISAAAPHGEARIRFPLLQHVLWLVNLPLPKQRTEIDTYVKHAVHDRKSLASSTGGQGWQSLKANFRAYVEGPFAGWFALASIFNIAWFATLGISYLPVFVSVGISLIAALAHVAALSRSWAGRQRYSWFGRQPYCWSAHDKPRDRPSGPTPFAARVMQARYTANEAANLPENPTITRRIKAGQSVSTAVELLLVNAFLEDLRQAYKRSVWKIWRRVTWTRTIYPMLLIDGRCPLLAQRFEEVRLQTATPDPLLLQVMPTETDDVSAVGRSTRITLDGLKPEDVDRAWQAWTTGLERDRQIGSRRTFTISIDNEHSRLLQLDGSIPRPARRKPLLSRLWVPISLVTILAAGPAAYVLVTKYGMCEPAIKRVDTGECIGIGDNGYIFDDRLKSILQHIDANNRTVMASGGPYATVYFFGRLSVPTDTAAGPGNLLADTQGELMGAAALQDRLIQNSRDETVPLLRILPVNAGSDYKYASDAAEAMLRGLTKYKNVVGVVGANESRETVQRALERLSIRALPILPTAATYDDLARVGGIHLPSVFPLAPPNSELARHTAHWAKTGIPGVLAAAKKAVVFMDASPKDLYASDLGNRFRKEFGEAAATKVEFSGADTIQPNVDNVCKDASTRPDLLYFAGRSAQFGEFHNAASKACQGITIIAGDAVTQYVNDRALQLANDSRTKMFYTPLASEYSWANVPSTNRTNFYQEYRTLLEKLKLKDAPVDKQPAPAFAAIAYDATDALMQATKDAYRAQRSGDPKTEEIDRTGVALALERLGSINGASGLVMLHSAADNHHARHRPVMLVHIRLVSNDGNHQAEQIVVAQCGNLYEGQPAPPSCPPERGR